MSKTTLGIALLDIKGAYDNVSQENFWVQLREYDLDAHLIRILQQVYTNDKVGITWEAEITKPAEIKRGLRQGCPLSHLLSIIYLSRMEKKLE